MVANVWMRILPAQQRMIDDTKAGRVPDYALGEAAKRRSVHNSYMTFPVLFIMLSNHFPGTYGHRLNWLILLLLIVAGAAARHVMIGRGRSRLTLGAAGAGLFLQPGTLPPDWGWRAAFGIGAALGLGILVLRRWIPESY